VTLPDAVAAEVDRYVDRHPDASVAQVLGRFFLDPEAYADAVAERLGEEPPTGTADGQPTLAEVAQ
jgi:hypothetical protein